MKQLEEKAAMPIQPMSFVAFFTDSSPSSVIQIPVLHGNPHENRLPRLLFVSP